MPATQAQYTKGANGFLERECPICMEPFLKGQFIMSCKHDNRHMFHTYCNRGKCVCPMCRSSQGYARNHLAEEMCTKQPDLQDAPFFSYARGKEYSGQWKNNVPHGSGTMRIAGGTVHVGQFVNGVANGKGTRTLTDGSVHEGQYKNGFMHGHGKMVHANGDVYEGGYANGAVHGNGKVVQYNGDIYEGEFADGAPRGYGKIISPNGSVYGGQVKDGEKHGRGNIGFSIRRV